MTNGLHALNLYKEHLPEFIVLDIELPNLSGLVVAKEILKVDRNARIVMVTGLINETTLFGVRHLHGIRGCALKSEDFETLLDCLRKVASGGIHFCKEYQRLIFHYLHKSIDPHMILSAEERKILCFVGSGYEDESIANLLGVPFQLVRSRIRRLRKKLNADSRVRLMAIANELGCASGSWKRLNLIGNYEVYD